LHTAHATRFYQNKLIRVTLLEKGKHLRDFMVGTLVFELRARAFSEAVFTWATSWLSLSLLFVQKQRQNWV
jgi:hypothetical protein